MGIYLGPFRFTKRGVRVRVGPRAMRLHVGAGGTGISTGFGPFTAYVPVRKKRRRQTAKTRGDTQSNPRPVTGRPTAAGGKPPEPAAAMPERVTKAQIHRVLNWYSGLTPEHRKLVEDDVQKAIAVYLLTGDMPPGT